MRSIYKENWLPHLENSIPSAARLNRTSLYTIALEGWRRGLSLKFKTYLDAEKIQRIEYILTNGERTHIFNESSGDMNKEDSYFICDNKELTYKYLKKANVPIPKSMVFTREYSVADIVASGKKMNYPLVVKPTNGSGGHGVFVNISTDRQLKEAVFIVRNKLGYSNIIIQEHVTGDEVRVYVLDEKVLSAVNRLPANVIGDGKNTIIKLIEFKNDLRKNVPHLYHRPINVDKKLVEKLKERNLSLDTILDKGQRVYLREVSNISTGGDPVEILNDLTEEQKEIAIKSVKAIPGLKHGGVDLMISQSNTSGTVLEVNTRPGIGSHLFPISGKSVDIPKKLMNNYFPETAHVEINNDFYFDLQSIFDALYRGYNSEIVVRPYPKGTYTSIKYKITCHCSPIKLYERLKNIILKYRINGFIKKEADDKIDLVISSNNDEVFKEILNLLEHSRRYLHIEEIVRAEYNKPIKIGFEIIDDLNELGLNELENRERESSKKIRKTEREVQRLEHRINLTEKSFSWRITSPLRMLSKKIKK